MDELPRYSLQWRSGREFVRSFVKQRDERREAGLRRSWWRRMSWRGRRWWSRLPPKSRFYGRTSQYRSERTAIVGWIALLAVAFVGLGGFAYLVGHESEHAGKGQQLFSWPIPRALAVTLTRPAVALPVAFGLLVFVAWILRRARLAWLVWRGGRVLVQDFQAGGELTGVKPPQLTALFRERLAVLRLQSASPSPGAAPEAAFLDIVTSREAVTGGILGPLLRLLRAAVPTYAIEVHGVIREREGRVDRYGVIVQVVQTPSQPSPAVEVWETSWERAIRAAADGATAAILPRSRLCRGPWAAWRGYAMPPELLSAYENASELEQERRFDEALDQYWEALRYDPTNLTVRLRLGQLQEKAGLFLAALTNYQRILAFGNPGTKNLPRGMYRRVARREWDRALHVTKYRAIVLLGAGSILREWSQPWGEQDAIPREKLHDEFKGVLTPLVAPRRRDPAADAISKATRRLLEVGPTMAKGQEPLIRRDLMFWSYVAARELKLSLPRLERRPWSQPLTRRTVALGQLCIERRWQIMGPKAVSITPAALGRLDRKIDHAGWRPGPWAGWWPSSLRRWQWHEHYNAACAYALSLNPHYSEMSAVDENVRLELVRRAVKRLERAITARDSEFVATWRDWVISEDRDLDRLREEPEFPAFEAMYFPSRGPARRPVSRRPQNPYRLAQSRYTRDLLAGLAQSWHETWHARAADTRATRFMSADAHVLLKWCSGEREMWRLVREVARDGYDWRTRRDLLKRANALLPKDRSIVVRFGGYGERTPEAGDGGMGLTLDGLLREERLRADARLAKLLSGQDGEADDEHAHFFANWDAAMQNYDAHGAISVEQRIGLCSQHANVWHRLSSWLCADRDIHADRARRDIERACDAFLAELGKTAGMWAECMHGAGGT